MKKTVNERLRESLGAHAEGIGAALTNESITRKRFEAFISMDKKQRLAWALKGELPESVRTPKAVEHDGITHH